MRERSWIALSEDGHDPYTGRFVPKFQWVGQGPAPSKMPPPLAVEHVGPCIGGCGVYICPQCERAVPWCFGADDEAPAICDECWGRLRALDAVPKGET